MFPRTNRMKSLAVKAREIKPMPRIFQAPKKLNVLEVSIKMYLGYKLH